MTKAYQTGQQVTWSWGDGGADGKVKEVFTDRVERTIKGAEIVRDADDDNPAYLVEQEDGDKVLKSHAELSKS